MSKPYTDYALSDTEMAVWETALRVRSDVNGVLETARADKRIGKSLEAHVALFANDEDAKAALDAVKSVDLPEIFIVSNVSTNETAPRRGCRCRPGRELPRPDRRSDRGEGNEVPALLDALRKPRRARPVPALCRRLKGPRRRI